jgi:hypothetical protein
VIAMTELDNRPVLVAHATKHGSTAADELAPTAGQRS